MANQVLDQDRPDVVLLQEASLAPTEVAGFARYVKKRGCGYCMYHQGPTGQRSGGVLTLVNRALPQRPALGQSMGSAEFLATFIAGWLFMNLYVHPREDGPSEGAQMTRMRSCSFGCRGRIPGCWPGISTRHPAIRLLLTSSLPSMGGSGRRVSLRGGEDWAASNRTRCMSVIQFAPWKLSDHKCLTRALHTSA